MKARKLFYVSDVSVEMEVLRYRWNQTAFNNGEMCGSAHFKTVIFDF